MEGAGCSYGASLLNQGTSACWIRENELSLALLRGYQNYTQYAKMGRERGMSLFEDGNTHTALAAERGDHRFCYALISGMGETTDIAEQALLYNSPLEAYYVETPVNIPTLLQVNASGFIITKLYRQKQGELYVRGYQLGEAEGLCELRFAGSIEEAQKVDLLDQPMQTLACQENTVCFEARPFEIVTLRIKEKAIQRN